ncbi:MAG: hypothetical protein NTV14_06980 [Coprothermobacterota bacterium]|nr:hypothetical protein [Coprothermobacterota bacterium]
MVKGNRKLIVVGSCSGLLGVFIGLLLAFLILVPSGIYLFDTPTRTPHGIDFVGMLNVISYVSDTLELYVNETYQGILQKGQAWSGVSSENVTRVPWGENRVWLKTSKGEILYVGVVDVFPDQATQLSIMPDRSTRTAVTNDFFPAFLPTFPS